MRKVSYLLVLILFFPIATISQNLISSAQSLSDIQYFELKYKIWMASISIDGNRYSTWENNTPTVPASHSPGFNYTHLYLTFEKRNETIYNCMVDFLFFEIAIQGEIYYNYPEHFFFKNSSQKIYCPFILLPEIKSDLAYPICSYQSEIQTQTLYLDGTVEVRGPSIGSMPVPNYLGKNIEGYWVTVPNMSTSYFDSKWWVCIYMDFFRTLDLFMSEVTSQDIDIGGQETYLAESTLEFYVPITFFEILVNFWWVPILIGIPASITIYWKVSQKRMKKKKD